MASPLPFFISVHPSSFYSSIRLYFYLNHTRSSLRLSPSLSLFFFFFFFFYSFVFFHDLGASETRTIHESYRGKRWCHFLNLDIAETRRFIAVLLPRGTDIIFYVVSRVVPRRRHLAAINFCSFFGGTSLSLFLSLEGEEKATSPSHPPASHQVVRNSSKEIGSDHSDTRGFHTVKIKRLIDEVPTAEKLRQVLRNASFSRRPLIDSHTVACEVCKAFALEGITYVYIEEGNVSRPFFFLSLPLDRKSVV